MVAIFILSHDTVLSILQHLDSLDQLAFAYTCQRFREICIDARIFKKVDLSRRAISRSQRGIINKFFGDKEMVQQIRELDLSNHRVLNCQMGDQLEEVIHSICPHLQALHVLNCAVSFQRLQRILAYTPKLTALSWSLRDLTSEEFEFLLKGIKSSNGFFFKNIKHLHLEAHESLSHIQVLKYLVLSCCKYLEVLEIYIWQISEVYCTELVYPVPSDWMIRTLPQPSASSDDMLQHLHSLTVVAVGGPSYTFPHYGAICEAELSNFVFSVMGKKKRETKWKKLWISPPIDISRLQDLLQLSDSSVPLSEDHPHELQSLEAVAVHTGQSVDAMYELETLFQRIGDNTVRSLHLCQSTSQTNSILELGEPILRVGGRALEFFRLSVSPTHGVVAEENIVLHTLFSNCLNITELDLLGCYFEKDICEPLSKLRHLTKVQLMECAISSKWCSEIQVEIYKADLLTFVENCPNITHFDVRGCSHYHVQVSCCLTGDELLLLSMLRNLESLTLYRISGIRQWTFLQNIFEHCQFLTMLRISAVEHFDYPILFKSAKFLKHLALKVPDVDFGSKVFWDLLSHATNLQRLCIRSSGKSINVPVAVEMLKRLPQLRVLHLHSSFLSNAEVVRNRMIRMFEEKICKRRFFFELAIGYCRYVSPQPWILQKTLPLNEVELCHMTPILAIPSS